VSVGSLTRHGLPSPLSGRRRTVGTGTFAAPALVAVAALTGLGAALRFYGLGHQGFWFDEANTAQLVRFPPGKMLGLIPQSESTPPLYYCVAWVWARVFGHDEAGLRSLSALCGVLTVPVAYLAGARLISRRAGLIAAALTAANPLLIWYSQEARSYSMLVLLSGLSLLAFVTARASPGPGALALWVVASALALATHYFAAVAVVPEAIWLLAERRRERPVQLAVGIVAACGLALIPLALSQNGTGHDSWIASAPLGLRLRQIVPQFLIGTGAPARVVLRDAALVLVVIATARLALDRRARERGPALIAGALALGGFVLSLGLAVVGFDDLITRNILALWLPAALLVAGGLAAWRGHAIGTAITTALCLIGVVAAVGVASERSLQRPDWRYVARELGATPAAHGGLAGRAILIQHYRTLLPLSLYLPGVRVMPAAGARVAELDVIAMRSPQQQLCWWGAACNLIPSRMQGRYALRGFHTAWTRRELQFTIKRLVAPTPMRLTPAAVARTLHTTRLRRDVLEWQRG
jgi:4-amino-4-deoxy-L-arabinose transferase-like glycosyltransferase